MKMKLIAALGSGTAVVALCLAGMCLLQTSQAQNESVPPPAPEDSTAPAAPDDSATLPPNIDTNSALAQVVKLIQSGVSEDVIMAYVTNSTSMFNPNPDQIIYLKDIGAPDEIVTAMMQRDQVLLAQTPAASYQPPQPAAPAPATTVAETAYVAPPPTVVTVDYFNETLAPYGSWVYVPGYGRCWRPTVTVVNAGWQPYCDHGHWVWTDCGWYWISDYSWGWAPFHYGRWFCDVRLGWCWYPDTVWGPSWVTWRYSSDYCGWAPLPPYAVYRAGVGFFYNGSAVSVGFNFGLGVSAFTFVPTRDFCDPHPWHYRVPPTHVTQIYNNTTIINNYNVDSHNRTFINHGIDPGRITAVTHREIRPVAIHETTGRYAHGEQLGRDGRTLYVSRPRFSDNPPPSYRGESRPAQPRPAVGSAYQGQGFRNGNPNNNPPSPRGYQSATAATQSASGGGTPHPAPAPPVGSAYQGQGPHNGSQNNNAFPSRNNPPVRTTTPPGQRQFTPPAASSQPGRSQTTTIQPAPSPGFNHAPITPWQPATPSDNFNNSTDNRRYPSPRMQATEVQYPPVSQGNNSGRVGASAPMPVPPARQPGATPFVPPAQSAVAAQPQPRSYVTPRSEPSPGGFRATSYQPPAAVNQQSSGSFQHSPAPAQSQGNGRNRNQNGQ